jgi:hypothetical protein
VSRHAAAPSALADRLRSTMYSLRIPVVSGGRCSHKQRV